MQAQEGELSPNCGEIPLIQSTTRKEVQFEEIGELSETLEGKQVTVRARVHNTRLVTNNLCFLVLRQKTNTVQVVLGISENVNKAMIKFGSSISRESIVEVTGTIQKASKPITSTSQSSIEIVAHKLFVVSRSVPTLPFSVEDASRSKALIAEKNFVKVHQDTRLNNRGIDLRTPANHAIFRVQSGVCMLFREFLLQENFIEIHTPKLLGAASEGGASVFKLPYFNTEACLAQSPQLYKQMVVCSGFERVFEIGPVFRAEHSNTHRHLTEFVGLDLEMSFNYHYHEVVDVIGNLFVSLFEGLQTKFAKEIEVIATQYSCEPLKFLKPTLRIEYREVIALLRGAGKEIGDTEDLSTANERELGRLVKAKYHTDFFILDKYPREVRPFYTMPNAEDPRYTNSYDLILRGEEISSGAQRIHEPAMLEKNAKEFGVEPATIREYIDTFKYGAPPHAGCGVGLERIVMLFLGLNNIRKTSLFPRDPNRIAP